GAPHRRCQLKARFVEEDEMGLALPGVADDAWELIAAPALHLLIVALAGAPLRLLTGPAQAVAEDFADVLGVKRDLEVPLDQAGHAVGGPQVGGPPVGGSPFSQQDF